MKNKMFLIRVLLPWSLAQVNPAAAKTWSQLVTSGSQPNTTAFNTTIYDSTNNRLVAFLPIGGSVASQVWTLTNSNGLGGTPTWTQLQPTGTAGVNNGGASAVYDALTNQLIVYGGCGGNCSPALASVYVLSNANGLGGTPAWSQSSPTSSIPRTGQTAVYDRTTNSMITFGGDTGFFGSDQNDTNVLSPANATSPAWTTLATSGGPPPVRDNGTAVYDTSRNRMIIFGGQRLVSCCPTNLADYNDVWVLSNANGHGGTPTWTQLQPQGNAPAPRVYHSAIYDTAGNSMFVFGGLSWSNQTQSYTAFGDVWKLSNANGLESTPPKWTQIGQRGTPPGGTAVQGAAFDMTNRRMISYGGEDRNLIPFFLTFILDLKQR